MIFHRRNAETQTNSKKGQMKIFYMFSFFTFSLKSPCFACKTH